MGNEKNHFNDCFLAKAPEREITLIFIFKDASPSLCFPLLCRQTAKPEAVEGVTRSGVFGWKTDGIPSAHAVVQDARLSPLVRCSGHHYIIHEFKSGQKKSPRVLLGQLGAALQEYKL